MSQTDALRIEESMKRRPCSTRGAAPAPGAPGALMDSMLTIGRSGKPKMKTPSKQRPAASSEKKRAQKQTTRWEKASKDRFEAAVHNLSFDRVGWTNDDHIGWSTLNICGSEGRRSGSRGTRWQRVAPTPRSLTKALDKFAKLMAKEYGEPFNCVQTTEFQCPELKVGDTVSRIPGNPHVNMLWKIPTALSLFGREAWEAVEVNWGIASGQRPATKAKNKRGRLSHTPQPGEYPRGATLYDTIAKFVGYSRKDGEQYADKRDQHRVPTDWLGSGQIKFWRIVGFTNARREDGEIIELVIRTARAAAAVRDFFRELSGDQGKVVEIDGEKIHFHYWDNHRYTPVGGTFNRRLTDSELVRLRRIISAFDNLEDPVELPPGPWECEGFDVDSFGARTRRPAGGYGYEPYKRSSKNYRAEQAAAPSLWERPDFDAESFIADLGRASAMIEYEPGEVPGGLPHSQTPDASAPREQRAKRATRTAARPRKLTDAQLPRAETTSSPALHDSIDSLAVMALGGCVHRPSPAATAAVLRHQDAEPSARTSAVPIESRSSLASI